MNEHEVDVNAGTIAGRRRGPITQWLGVPYAAPPVGNLRFRSPDPVPPWTGTRSATQLGHAATQSGSLTTPLRQLGGVAEDCLYLNLYAPSAPGAPRPVLVWIHGGAFTGGSGGLYDGSELAELGDLVVVTVNYRLGVFGFADLAAVTDADVPSNLGLRDQIAALEWVRDNIAAFGGDPDRVTVAGESAGSISVALLTTASQTAGLFRAAIMQSGSYTLIHGPEVSLEVAHRYAAELQLGPDAGRRLRELPAAQLLAAQVTVAKAVRNTLPAAPWFDDDLVPASVDAARAVPRPEIALLAGHTHDEVSLFHLLPGDIMPTTRPAITARLHEALGAERTAAILAAYPSSPTGLRALGTDVNFALGTQGYANRHQAAGGSTYFYRFDAAVPVLGATHASELPYLWGWSGLSAVLLRGRLTPERRELGTRLRDHWVAFVRDLSPGPGWPVFGEDRATMIFDPHGDRVEHDPSRVRRTVWAGAEVMPRA